MKKIIALFLCLAVLVPCIPNSFAINQEDTLYYNQYTLDNGMTVTDRVTVVSDARATEKTAYRESSIHDGNTLVAYIRFESRFRYDGSTVAVVSKTVTNTDTYDGWEYVQNSFTSAGGTVTLNAKITKWFIFHTTFTMTLSCDKDGNITYT